MMPLASISTVACASKAFQAALYQD